MMITEEFPLYIILSTDAFQKGAILLKKPRELEAVHVSVIEI